MVDAEPPQCNARRDRDENAREHLHAHETLDLQVDFVEDLHGDLFFRQRAAADLDELPLVEIARDQKEIDEKQHQDELPGKAQQPMPPDHT